MNKKQMDYQNAYIKAKYDRINITIPKGRKEAYKQQAAAEGKSLNTIINEMLQHWCPAPEDPDDSKNKLWQCNS